MQDVWDVEVTDEFENWWGELDEEEQESVSVVVELLIKEGPMLPFPYSSDVKGAKKHDIRELRIQHQGNPYRVLYAFDPRRSALLILGGDKSGNSRWYLENVTRAEKLYDEHLRELRKEGWIK